MEDDKPAVTITSLELLLLNCIVCGLEMIAGTAITYLPPMLLEAGFEEKHMSWVLGTAPFLCVIFVPIMGQWMDVCTSRFGRRIPFMAAFCAMVIVALLMIPYADHHVSTTAETGGGYSMHAWLLAFSVVLIDFATQAGLTPCEVFLQDVTKGLPIRDKAFSLYSLMCSVGACAGYLTTSTHWEKTFVGAIFGDQEYCVFSILFCVFIILVMFNLFTASRVRARQKMMQSFSTADLRELASSPMPVAPRCASSSRGCVRLRRILALILPRGINNMFTVPYALQRLIISNFFAWAGVMCFLLFFTDYVGEIVYDGKPSAAPGTPDRLIYEEGVRMGSFGLLLHAITSSSCAPLIESAEHKYGMKTVHLTALSTFTVCLCLILTTKNVIIISLLAMITGVAFSTMTTVPFSLIGMYHDDKEVFFADTPETAKHRGLGADMATMDTAYFCSQVLLLTFMGYIVHVTGTATMYIIMSASLSGISCYFVSTMIYTEQDILARLEKMRTNLPKPPQVV